MNRFIMTGITIEQISGRQIKHANEQRNKHIGFITLASRLIDEMHDMGRIVLVCRESTEK